MMYNIHNDDCLKTLPKLIENSIDSCVTDPPYNFASILSRFGNTSKEDNNKTGEDAKTGRTSYARLAGNFMGKTWDNDIAYNPQVWKETLRVLKPGGHLLAFAATKTYHRIACAIEDAGFEIRDQLAWIYGTGFPKSHKVGPGQGTALKPGWEPIVLARKPLDTNTVKSNVEKHGTGGLQIESSRLEGNRFPANLLIEDDPEVHKHFPDGVTRFFYSAKASKAEKGISNTHPTVKPISVMKYLTNLVTPKGGTVIDPFMGSGTTGIAALQNGFDFVGIEQDKEYYEIARDRLYKS